MRKSLCPAVSKHATPLSLLTGSQGLEIGSKTNGHHYDCICTVKSLERDRNGTVIKTCVSAYKAYQISRLLTNKIGENPEIASRTIESLIDAKETYARELHTHFYRRVKKILNKGIENPRSIEMALVEGYAELLRKAGHK